MRPQVCSDYSLPSPAPLSTAEKRNECEEGERGDIWMERRGRRAMLALCVLRWNRSKLSLEGERREDTADRTDRTDCLNEEKKHADATAANAALQYRQQRRSSVALSVNDCSWFTAFF